MDTIVEGPSEEGVQVQEHKVLDGSNWTVTDQNIETNNSNSTLLYIAVEYVKDYKIETNTNNLQTQDTYTDFTTHVSPLDPNMSSVARYSPVPVHYQEQNSEFNPVVIHQFVTQNSNEQYDASIRQNTALEVPTVLCSNDIKEVDNRYLEMVNEENVCITSDNGLQLVNENSEQQEVELLITDQATGMSYSVNAQELLVERCLDEDQQLLEALAPNPLLESDLLTLDDNTLKSELNDEIIDAVNINTVVNTQAASNFVCNNVSRSENLENINNYKIEMNDIKHDFDSEDQLLSCVYSIADKPILSRARASLPESYLTIGCVNEENAVFTKKTIPKCTQFGPLEGILVPDEQNIKAEDTLKYLIEVEMNVYRMDLSDENNANWMSFVRRAETCEEQNLVVSQENDALYFTTTRNILPKQELKVGYSVSYAQKFNLPILQPNPPLENWPCYECSATFGTSQELQNHLNIHDVDKDENMKPKKKWTKKKFRFIKRTQVYGVECNICDQMFDSGVKFNALKNHLVQKHQCKNVVVGSYFTTITSFKCNNCELSFKSDALLKIHNLDHNPDLFDEQISHVCPQCQRKFPTQKQLVCHVLSHSLSKSIAEPDRVKCPSCHKIFSHIERLQKHMLVHGSEESKPLQCKTCNKRFLNNSALACHIKTHYTDKKLFECPICMERFENVLKLKLHVPKHSSNNVYTCPHCKKVFKKYSIIRKHIRAFHCERKHNCQQCSKMFPTLDKLRMHLLRHSDHREFLCADCGKQFKRKDKLKEHCKRMHSEERENNSPRFSKEAPVANTKTFSPKVEPNDFHRFIYKCHSCMVGFKRRGMLVNHLAKRHPDIKPDSVPELNLPILQTTRDYYCQYCDKVYKSSSKRKSHILKNHPGAALPMSNRKQAAVQETSGLPNPTFSQTVGSVTTRPQSCKWCHKQYASKAKLLQHQRKKHPELLAQSELCQVENIVDNPDPLHIDKEHENIKSQSSLEETTQVDVDVKEDNFNIDTISSDIERYNVEDDSQFCNLSIDENIIESDDLDNPNSHLYELLTANNGMLPPR